MDNNAPPPAPWYDDIPDYVLGKLLYYDQDSDNACRWIVYDGAQKIRCATRKDAIRYIQMTVLHQDNEAQRLTISARAYIQKALEQLDKAATKTSTNSLLLERLSVKLRPFVVDLDNLILTDYDKKSKKAHLRSSAC